MIIKFKTRKNIYTAKQLVGYLLTDKGKIEEPFSGVTFLQNITRVDPETMHRDFTDNFKFQPKRKLATALYHEVLSIHPKDERHVTEDMIRDMMRVYVKMRGAENALVLGKYHSSEAHKHIHFMLSGGDYKSKKRLRMSKARMKKLLKEFERYHQKTYPELKHSIIHLKEKVRSQSISENPFVKEDKSTRKEKEYQVKRRYEKEGKGRMTQKEKVTEKVNKLLNGSPSFTVLVERIFAAKDLQMYTYRGKIKGVIFTNEKGKSRKYRFETLGIEVEKIRSLETVKSRLAELDLIKETYRGRGRGR